MDTKTILTIITSAGIGALVSSLVTLVSQFLERRSRLQEILLGKSIDFAIQRIELIKQAATNFGGTARTCTSELFGPEETRTSLRIYKTVFTAGGAGRSNCALISRM